MFSSKEKDTIEKLISFRQVDGGKEKHDCTVRALSIAAELSYIEAHALLQQGGRRDGHRFHFEPWISGQTIIGKYKVCTVHIAGGRRLTFNQLVRSALPGRFIARTRGHVCAIIDGVVHDTLLEGKKRRVKNLWKFETIDD